MLPATNRMRRPAQFSQTLRRGSSAARGSVVVHRWEPIPSAADVATDVPAAASGPAGAPATTLVGLIVGRGVGGSVVRHRVSRRLRAQLAARLDRVADGTHLVVRARPSAAQADSATLGADLDRALAAGRRGADTRS